MFKLLKVEILSKKLSNMLLKILFIVQDRSSLLDTSMPAKSRTKLLRSK